MPQDNPKRIWFCKQLTFGIGVGIGKNFHFGHSLVGNDLLSILVSNRRLNSVFQSTGWLTIDSATFGQSLLFSSVCFILIRHFEPK
jgi:hypothetical protein